MLRHFIAFCYFIETFSYLFLYYSLFIFPSSWFHIDYFSIYISIILLFVALMISILPPMKIRLRRLDSETGNSTKL